MKLTELDDAERFALMALLKLVISSDRQLSKPESGVLLRVADEMGPEVFKAARQDAADRLHSTAQFDAAIAAVARPEARALLYRLAFEAAEADALIAAEIERLLSVAKRWSIEVDPETGRPRD